MTTPSLAIISLILPPLLLLLTMAVHPCFGFPSPPPPPSSRIRSRLAGRGSGFGPSSSRGGTDDDRDPGKKSVGGGGKRRRTRSETSVGFLGELSEREGWRGGSKSSSSSSSSSSPSLVLDRFGFPPPTEEEVFPPLSNDVVRVPVDGREYDRAYVVSAISRHLGVNLDAFDDSGRSVHVEGGGEEDDGRTTTARWSLRMIHVDPPIFLVEDFLTASECESLSSFVDDDDDDDKRVRRIPSPTFSSSSSSSVAVSRRTSTTWFCRYDAVPALLAKARRLLGVDLNRMEEPQVVRYRPGEEFTWHYDEVPRSGLSNGGQRLATLLVYLNDLGKDRGGGTAFRDLLGMEFEDGDGEGRPRRGRLVVTPRKGTALLFFPAYQDGTPDERTLHRGEAALDDKTIAQIWIHEGSYRAGTPEGNRQSCAMDGVEYEARRLGFS
ncbi:hypothetical protein ACHAXA_004859 [Cyclostephanos tholiformis]|uniref:Fe2OG dioxygenase domain-containing protein n=1 Tax=Cyclostephanos tholiformis TaxID=382380 RepID=A0ABD3SH62_9STRA